MESDNYKIVDIMHGALGNLLHVSTSNKEVYEKHKEYIQMAMEVYQKYLEIIGQASAQFKPNFN